MWKYFKESEVEGLDTDLVRRLDRARELAGTSFIITSGLRSASHNEDVGGVLDSSHLTGLAVDLACGSSEKRMQVLRGLIDAGFQRIGIYSTHIHTDIDPLKPQNIIYLAQ